MTSAHWILACLVTALSVIAAGDATLRKRDPKAALGWVAFCLTLPIFGALIYFLFGINRIRTRARKLEKMKLEDVSSARLEPEAGATEETPSGPLRVDEPAAVSIDDLPPEFSELARVSEAVTGLPLAGGNRIEMLHNGEQAFPAMLEAIDGARETLYLATYIFESNATGHRFVDALARAVERGVEVRVLIDGFGEWYSESRISRILARRGVRVGLFLKPKLIPPTLHFNLRNHRKVLVADGWTGFTGGMNVGDRHLAADLDNPKRVVDVHFRLEGPVVRQLEKVFLEDWRFTSGETLESTAVDRTPRGAAICRAVVDGPNEDLDKLVNILVGAVSAARRKVAIMSPYFLPPRPLASALAAAALRGVEVTVILPELNNLLYIHWATRNMLWEILERGVRVYYQPPPFVHSKLFVVDDHYTQIGSANFDTRSLRLNFELVVEVFDQALSRHVAAHFEEVRLTSREVFLEEVDGRPFLERLRDSLFWLFSPYL
jgi:cardiolipin synthase A/B